VDDEDEFELDDPDDYKALVAAGLMDAEQLCCCRCGCRMDFEDPGEICPLCESGDHEPRGGGRA
jgi:hypothetical protein